MISRELVSVVYVLCMCWIKKDLPALKDTHLGLDLVDANIQVLENLSKDVLENIDLEKLEDIASFTPSFIEDYPFENFKKVNKKNINSKR